MEKGYVTCIILTICLTFHLQCFISKGKSWLYHLYGSREITWELTVVLCMGGNADAAGTESAFPLIVFVF